MSDGAKGLTRQQMCDRLAMEFEDGWVVNLGIGIPTLVANYVPEGLKIFFQSENGLIGTGPIPEEGMSHPTLTDAAGHAVLGSGTSVVARRKPVSLNLLVGSAEDHADARRALELSLEEPPRIPRREPGNIVSFHSDTLPAWSNVP